MQPGYREEFGMDRPGGWYVEVATGRVVRKPTPVVPPVRGGAYWTSRTWEAPPVSKDKDAKSDLNPIEDIKGAVKFVKGLHPIEEVKEFMETAAKVLEPAESDVRVVEPESDTVSELAEPDEHGRPGRPVEASPQPDVRALNKEHRGY